MTRILWPLAPSLVLALATGLPACGSGGGSFTTTADAGPDVTDDTLEEDSGAVDTGTPDTMVDTGDGDTDPPDTLDDTTPTDTGPDTTETDTGPVDTGTPDTGPSTVPSAVGPVSGGGVVRSEGHVARIVVGGAQPRGLTQSDGHRAALGWWY